MNAALALLSLWLLTADAVKIQSGDTCSLVTFIPFTDTRANPPAEIIEKGEQIYGYGQWSSPKALGKAGFSLMATAQMAKDHFNARDVSVVPELKNYESCGITFPENWYIDSAYDRNTVVEELLQITRTAQDNGLDPDNAICAVIGPIEARANEGASVITGNLRIPQIAYETIDKRLARKTDFPTFVRGLPAAEDLAKTIAEYVQRDIWKRDFVGVIYDQSDYGEQFEDPLENAEDDLKYITLTEHVLEDDINSMHASLGTVEAEGFHTVVFAADRPAILDNVARVAEKLNIIGQDYVWFLTGDIAPPELFNTLRYNVDSPIDKLLRGAALITNYDPFVYEPEGDAFLEEWKKQGDEMLTFLRSQHPLVPTDDAYFVGESGYFQSEVPTEYASFLYDAIMNAGMAACRAQENDSNHIEEVFKSNFEGASGRNKFKEPNTRDTDGVKFGVYNVRPGPIDEATNTRGYTRHLTAIYDGTKQKWIKVEGEEFIFFDGTSKEPGPVRETIDWNYLSKSIQIVGFVVVGLSLFINLISALWVFVRRKEKIVTTAQAEFLYLICFGGALVAGSLICISFDESYGWSDAQLDKACAALPWLFVIGYLIQYCAVFSKLWRLSKLLSLRRRAVDFKQVLLPFALIITSSIVVLVLWQVLAPLQWERELQTEKPPDDELSEEPWVSYGECKSEDIGVIPFIVPLSALFAIIIFMTLAISWKMRDVQSELSEAKWIFIAIFSHLQFWAIGIPVYLILNGISADAVYLISTALVFVFANAFVVLIIGPRMIQDIRENYFGSAPSNKRQSRISIKQGSTYVSGMNSAVQGSQQFQSGQIAANDQFSSAASYNDDKLKILSLEAEIEDLKKEAAASIQEGGEKAETAPLMGSKNKDETQPMDADCEPKNEDA